MPSRRRSSRPSTRINAMRSHGCGAYTASAPEVSSETTWSVNAWETIQGTTAIVAYQSHPAAHVCVFRVLLLLLHPQGLGKTVQIASYLSGLFSSRQVKRVLLVAPLSVLGHWERELENWASASASSKSRSSGSSLKLLVLTSSGSKSKRDAAEAELRAMLTSSSSRGGIVLTTYGLLTSRGELFGARAFTNPSIQTWDYGVLDEGHIAKNPDTILARMLRSVPIAHRLLLSGTPVMNHLEEMWSLFDWTSGGTLLGERSAFRNEFSRPIAAGIAKGASKYERETGAALTAELRRRIEPFFLRRDKSMLAQHQTQGASNATASSHSPSSSSFIAAAVAGASSSPSIPVQKNDLIVWTYLSPLQVSLYTSFLSSSRVKAIFTNQTRSPLVALSVLKKVCDHPRLLSEEMKLCEGIGEEIGRLPSLPTGSSPEDLARAVQQLTSESSKMRLLESLLASHVEEGHRTLVFCQSRKVLGMISLLLAHHQWRHLRIDGGVADHRERQRRMDLFNADTRYKVFILTTRAGAVGLNLVGADRVVICKKGHTRGQGPPGMRSEATESQHRFAYGAFVLFFCSLLSLYSSSTPHQSIPIGLRHSTIRPWIAPIVSARRATSSSIVSSRAALSRR